MDCILASEHRHFSGGCPQQRIYFNSEILRPKGINSDIPVEQPLRRLPRYLIPFDRIHPLQLVRGLP
jgi:hypothetical protein